MCVRWGGGELKKKKVGKFCPSACQYLSFLCLTIALPCNEKPLSLLEIPPPLKPQLRNAMCMPYLCLRIIWTLRGIASVKSNTDVFLFQHIMIYMLWMQCDTRPFISIVLWNTFKKFLTSIYRQRGECCLHMTERSMDMKSGITLCNIIWL